MPKTPNTMRANKNAMRDRRRKLIKDSRTGAAAKADELRHRAIHMRIAGHNYRAIADALGISTASAYKYSNDGWDRLNDLTDDDRRKLRRQEAMRLDEALAVVMAIIRAPDLIVERSDRQGNVVQEDGASLKMRAIDRLVKIGKLRSVIGTALKPPKDADDIPKGEPFMPLDQLVAIVERQQAELAAAKNNPIVPMRPGQPAT